MPRTREKIWRRARIFEPNDHLGRKLKTMEEIEKEVEKDASRQQNRISEGSGKEKTN